MFIADYNNPIGEKSLKYGEKETIGLVVKNIDDTKKDDVLGVYVPRLMFGLDISQGAYETTESVDMSKLANSKNTSIGSSSVGVQNYVTLPVAKVPNINTPYFRKGENVFIANMDRDIKTMYILPHILANEKNKRKTDRFAIIVNNYKKDSREAPTLANTYGLVIDSVKEIITIWTSKNNKEKGDYTFSINAKEGKFLFSDSGKRTLEMDTEEDRWTMLNDANSKIEMVKDVINMEAGTLNIKIKNDINIESETMDRQIKTSIKTNSPKDEEHIDDISFDGNTWKTDYSSMTNKSNTLTNKTMKYVTYAPIASFSELLTTKEFSISPVPGVEPPSNMAHIDSQGVWKMGNGAAINLARAQPVEAAILQIAQEVDTIATHVDVPPTLTSTVATLMRPMASQNALA